MQNIMQPQPRAPWAALSRPFRIVALSVLFMGLFLLVAVPQASAKSYTMPQVDITAEVQSDGSLHVTEQRTFDFDGSFTAVWWTMDNLPSNATLTVDSVSVAYPSGDEGSEEGVTFESLPETEFQTQWRDSGGPGDTSYSVDEAENTTYVFFDVADASMIVRYEYTVENAVQVYADCADLYWKFVGDGWAEDSQNVTCTVSLPVPGNTTPVVGSDVYAWGHGPLSGRLSFNDSASVVTYTEDRVPAGEYAEAHILLPVSWLGNVSDEARDLHSGQDHLDSVLEEEQDWADAANVRRLRSLTMFIVLGIVTLAFIGWAVVMFLLYGREHKPTFTDEYWRDVPHKGVHPAVIGRLCRWNRESNVDFTATIMHLANAGVISINKGSYDVPGSFGKSKRQDDYYITLNGDKAKRLSPIDRKAVDFLFKDVAKGKPSLWLGSISLYGQAYPEEFDSAMRSWNGQVSLQVNKRGYFESKGSMVQGHMVSAVAVFFCVMLGAAFFMENFWPLLFGLVGCVAVFAVSNFMPRRSQEGVDDYAKAMALKKWLEDFTALDERVTTDVKVWGEFMVYAYLFGIADKVVKELRDVVPEMFSQDDAWVRENDAYVPWYLWYSSTSASGGIDAFGDAFNRMWDNTVDSARDAIAAASAASDGGSSGGWSSGGGFGGGFSGGGGGGFGGGGGAR